MSGFRELMRPFGYPLTAEVSGIILPKMRSAGIERMASRVRRRTRHIADAVSHVQSPIRRFPLGSPHQRDQNLPISELWIVVTHRHQISLRKL
jgi:hypothetical protein